MLEELGLPGPNGNTQLVCQPSRSGAAYLRVTALDRDVSARSVIRVGCATIRHGNRHHSVVRGRVSRCLGRCRYGLAGAGRTVLERLAAEYGAYMTYQQLADEVQQGGHHHRSAVSSFNGQVLGTMASATPGRARPDVAGCAS